MTQMNTQVGLNFIGRYDYDKNGLSRAELQQGAIESHASMMVNMLAGNAGGFMQSMQNLQFATGALQNFDTLSQASYGHMPDNPTTISPFDLMKTASNDGNMQNISQQDMQSQQQQNQMKNPLQMMMQFFMMMFMMMMQMMGMAQQQQTKPFQQQDQFMNAGVQPQYGFNTQPQYGFQQQQYGYTNSILPPELSSSNAAWNQPLPYTQA